MHDLLFENQQSLNGDNFKKWAKDLKLDMKTFEKDLSDSGIEKLVNNDADFARNNGAGGTPSFFIGKQKAGQDTIEGVLLVGAQPKEKFKEVIDALLAEKP